jgi:hypothetical protein
MRYLFGLLCVCALAMMPVVGCDDAAGDGGTAGSGGTAGDGGNGGEGGGGGTVVTNCTGAGDGTECASGDVSGFCFHSACYLSDCDGVEDGSECAVDLAPFVPGLCTGGSCELECEDLEDGSACRLGEGAGVCSGTFCIRRCEDDTECDDYNECVVVCLDNGLCSEGNALEDGTPCAGGTCQSGECVLESSVLPCTDQGIRNALAAGGGPYTFECDGPTTIEDVDMYIIEKDVSLDGEGDLTIEGFFWVYAEAQDVQVSFTGLNLRGIWGQPVQGNIITLSVTDSVVRGSGIQIDGALTLIDSTVSESGVIEGVLLTIVNSTISGTGRGIVSNEQLVLINSTVSGNGDSDLGPEDASGIYVGGDATLINSTVSGNHDAPDIYVDGTLTMRNSIIDGVCSVGGVAGSIVSSGYNLESPGDTCGFDAPTDLVNVSADDLKLGELADNDGPTMTHALEAGSVAIDVIPQAMCEADDDQRGEPRPGGTMCDVGAFEVQP